VSVVVVATITRSPTTSTPCGRRSCAAVPQVHAEPGASSTPCTRTTAVRDGGALADADALKVHGKAEALTTLGGSLAGKLAGAPDVRRLTAGPAGDRQGRGLTVSGRTGCGPRRRARTG
jgi:hypothetical protein